MQNGVQNFLGSWGKGGVNQSAAYLKI